MKSKQKKPIKKITTPKAIKTLKTPSKPKISSLKTIVKKNNTKDSKFKPKNQDSKPSKPPKNKLTIKTKNKVENKIKNPKTDKIKTPTKKLPNKITTKPQKNHKSEQKKPEVKTKKNPKNLIDKPTEILNFSLNSYVVYPSHGVGKIISIEENIIANQKISCYHIFFDKEKLSIKIPVKNSDKFGIRALSSKAKMEEVLSILRSGIKKMKGMWSRRAQEYETKINSGDIIMLAEVLRDLTRDIDDSERSYSERIIYETAIFRLACEYCAIYNVSFDYAKDKIIMTAKDKIESDKKTSVKDDGFDDFDNIKHKKGDDEEEEDEEDDFNYEYNENDDFDDEDDDTPKKRKK